MHEPTSIIPQSLGCSFCFIFLFGGLQEVFGNNLLQLGKTTILGTHSFQVS